jgi:hypothetical protein
MRYHLLSAALVVAAIIMEMAGYGTAGSDLGATLFAAGAAAELWFWIRIGVAKKNRHHGTSNA